MGPYQLVSEPGSMETNKERIELLEVGFGGVQDGMQKMELGMSEKLWQLEETIHKLTEALLSNKGESSQNNTHQESNSCTHCEEDEGNKQVNTNRESNYCTHHKKDDGNKQD